MRFRHWIGEAEIEPMGGGEEAQKARREKQVNQWVKQAKETMGLPPTTNNDELMKALDAQRWDDPTKGFAIQQDLQDKQEMGQLANKIEHVQNLNELTRSHIDKTKQGLQGPALQTAIQNIKRAMADYGEATVDDNPTIPWMSEKEARGEGLTYSQVLDPHDLVGLDSQMLGMLNEAKRIAKHNWFSMMEIWKMMGWKAERGNEFLQRIGEASSSEAEQVVQVYRTAMNNLNEINHMEKMIGLDKLSAASKQGSIFF